MARRSDFHAYFLTLSDQEQERFARDAGTTANYIRVHLLAPERRRKIPRKKLMDGLTKALEDRGTSIDKNNLVQYFYGAS